MLIHGTKATRDLEERLPPDMLPEHRDALLRILWAVRTGEPVAISEVPARLLWLAEQLAGYVEGVRERQEEIRRWEEASKALHNSLKFNNKFLADIGAEQVEPGVFVV